MKNHFENREYDVAVCGGGVAGIAAALAAARMGKRVVLFEHGYMLGGLATAGLVTIYLPLCDGYGHQVSFGLAEELLRLSVKYGTCSEYRNEPHRYPANWLDGVGTRTEKDERFRVRFNGHVFAILAEQLLLSEGVDILYGSYVTDVTAEAGKIKSLFVENKSGRCAYYVTSVVDATGDCDIALFADAPTATYAPGNMLAAWYYYANEEEGYTLRKQGAADVSEEERMGNDPIELLPGGRFTGLDGKEISEFMFLAHKMILSDWLAKNEKDSMASIATIPTVPQLRMTRRIAGAYTLSEGQDHTYFEDSIGMVSDWRKRGPVYEVPYRTLYSPAVKNLIVAGRCTSTDDEVWDVMRVIPCCAVTGQAAGTAAAMTDDFTALDVKALQDVLVKAGVVLHERDLAQ